MGARRGLRRAVPRDRGGDGGATQAPGAPSPPEGDAILPAVEAIGEKGLVTVTATVLPGCVSGVHVASTATVVPTVLLWTNVLMSSLVAVPRGLVAPRTTAQRTPSLAPADTALYAKINRPASTIPNN